MRRPGQAAVGLGAVTLFGSWLFGSAPLVPAGAGLVAAGLVSLGWHRLVSRRLTVERAARPRLVEGEPLRVELRIAGGRLPLGRVTVVERIGRLGEQEAAVRRGRATLTVERPARGRYALGPATIVLEDPLRLERVSREAGGTSRVLVRPRVVAVERLFTTAGGRSSAGWGRLVRSAGGVELHGIREYREGEPLRAVHWPSTARRGQLMVRELEDPSRDQVALVLDGDRVGDVGPRGESSFDEAVRVVAAIARATVVSGRRVRLIVHGATTAIHTIGSGGEDWEAALDALAAVEADASVPVHAILGGGRNAAAGASETIVVTARPSTVLGRRLGGTRQAALVVIDAPSYASGGRRDPDPALLRLAASGTALAVVRKGDDLGTVLSSRRRERVGA